MSLAISNIAWEREDDPAVATLLAELGIPGVEIAPTKIWEKPLEATEADARAYRRFWEEHGVRIVSMQALLFGRADLAIFEGAERRRETLDYLRGVMRLGGWLGAGPLVFGSPKNRLVGDRDPAEVEAIAVEFFTAVGEAAVAEGVVLCIEPNPPAYACEWVTRSEEGLAVVRKVAHPGFGLHLDAAGMTLAGESPAALRDCAGQLCHFHVSEPQLGAIGEGGVDHAGFAAVLAGIGYPHHVSVEMRHDPERETLAELRRVLELVKGVYGRVMAPDPLDPADAADPTGQARP